MLSLFNEDNTDFLHLPIIIIVIVIIIVITIIIIIIIIITIIIKSCKAFVAFKMLLEAIKLYKQLAKYLS